jgi:hypothetical protein
MTVRQFRLNVQMLTFSMNLKKICWWAKNNKFMLNKTKTEDKVFIGRIPETITLHLLF